MLVHAPLLASFRLLLLLFRLCRRLFALFTLYLRRWTFRDRDCGADVADAGDENRCADHVGWLSDRAGRRVVIIQLSGIASLAGFLVFFFTTRFEGLFVAMALMAFFWSAALPLFEGLTFNHLAERASVYGQIRSWGSVGFVVAVLGIGYLLDHLPIGSLLWMTAAVLFGIRHVAPGTSSPKHRDRLPMWRPPDCRRFLRDAKCGRCLVRVS